MGFTLDLQRDSHPCRGPLVSMVVDGRFAGLISAMGEKRAEDTEQMFRSTY